MKTKALLIGGIAAVTLFAGGWALAQATGPGGFGPPSMGGMGPGGMGRGVMGSGGMGHGMMMQHMGPGMHQGKGAGMMGGASGFAFADPAQIETLKKDLNITAAQEPAWAKYAKTTQDAAATMKANREGMDHSAIAKLSQQDRIAFMTSMREQHLTQFEQIQAAADELLTTLDDKQKIKAQETLPGVAFGPGAMRSAGMGRMHDRH
jgi:hypothetical protein